MTGCLVSIGPMPLLSVALGFAVLSLVFRWGDDADDRQAREGGA